MFKKFTKCTYIMLAFSLAVGECVCRDRNSTHFLIHPGYFNTVIEGRKEGRREGRREALIHCTYICSLYASLFGCNGKVVFCVEGLGSSGGWLPVE